ncbi:MFS transporter [Ureibacillus chungkukjangi]|uniref:MFS transporter n=1 Tax=Ureibacillus chungkukjangi TaxID=1202712 RepID=A0A318TP71_9BACL|nr:MFS transporter [Ureibacillus chungkukjangi]MCM3390030.1 MFS transporter [Ureibacillus chungkukjangi]PYF03695.1 MFS transporter [Ureibacillus chungkukjangi]
MSKWKYPFLLLGGIGISNVGGWVYLIALNLIILNETGSPLAIALLYMLGPIATICSNVWSGSLIDRINTRRLMMLLDFFRAFCIALIPLSPSLIYMYVLAFLINIGSAIFEPTSMVYMTKLIPEEARQRFNALRSFLNSCGSLIGPSIAGLLFWMGTPYTAIYVNAVALFCSVLILMMLPNVDSSHRETKVNGSTWGMVVNDFRVIFNFSKRNSYITRIYLLFSGTIIFMTAIDSLEAAFAKKVLSISDTNYGFLLSIFGAGIILSSIINIVFSKQLAVTGLIGFGTIFTSIGYVLFYGANGFVSASFAVFIIGLAVTFGNTGYLTYFQDNIPTNMMGRFISIFSVIEAALIISLTLITGLASEFSSIRPVGLVASFAFFILGLIAIKTVNGGKGANLENVSLKD